MMADGPLHGIRILDLTHVCAGPLAARILADLGADVVKVEAPASRGPLVWSGAPLGGWIGGDPRDEPWNRNAAFVKLARNRRSLCIDLKAPAGRSAFLDLVQVADVVIENFSARAMPSLGLGYDSLKAANPRIVYVTMPGFGTTGPYRDRVAFGPTVEPISGLTCVMGYGPEEPRSTAMALMDPIAAMSAASAVVTALRARERTGVGTYVELSLFEAGVSYSGPWLIEHQLGGRVHPIGNRHPHMAPHGVYRCSGADAWVAVACRTDAQWRSLCALLDASLDPDATSSERQAAHDDIDAAITAWTSTRSKEDAAVTLQALGIAAGPVNIVPDMADDPQVTHREFFVPLEEATPVPGNPVKMAGVSPQTWSPCPPLGADNRAVLADWLDYDEAQIADLERTGVLAQRPPA
jgi:crotonobetainyl-CoA:carnitine CoA-transferase CaiB-like acyl-CoA transferase